MEKTTGAGGSRLALFLLSNQQDFQLEQEAVAREAAARMGMTIEVAFNENSPLTQIQQILDITHRPVPSARPPSWRSLRRHPRPSPGWLVLRSPPGSAG